MSPFSVHTQKKKSRAKKDKESKQIQNKVQLNTGSESNLIFHLFFSFHPVSKKRFIAAKLPEAE